MSVLLVLRVLLVLPACLPVACCRLPCAVWRLSCAFSPLYGTSLKRPTVVCTSHLQLSSQGMMPMIFAGALYFGFMPKVGGGPIGGWLLAVVHQWANTGECARACGRALLWVHAQGKDSLCVRCACAALCYEAACPSTPPAARGRSADLALRLRCPSLNAAHVFSTSQPPSQPTAQALSLLGWGAASAALAEVQGSYLGLLFYGALVFCMVGVPAYACMKGAGLYQLTRVYRLRL
jgi:hypothetical protein